MAFDWEQITEQITDRLNLSKERMAAVVRLLVQAGVVVAVALQLHAGEQPVVGAGGQVGQVVAEGGQAAQAAETGARVTRNSR